MRIHQGDVPEVSSRALRAQNAKLSYSVGDSGVSAAPKRPDVHLKIRVLFFFLFFSGTGSYIESQPTESSKDRQVQDSK